MWAESVTLLWEVDMGIIEVGLRARGVGAFKHGRAILYQLFLYQEIACSWETPCRTLLAYCVACSIVVVWCGVCYSHSYYVVILLIIISIIFYIKESHVVKRRHAVHCYWVASEIHNSLYYVFLVACSIVSCGVAFAILIEWCVEFLLL